MKLMDSLSFENIENKIGNTIFSFPCINNASICSNDYIRNNIYITIFTISYSNIINDVNGNLINEING